MLGYLGALSAAGNRNLLAKAIKKKKRVYHQDCSYVIPALIKKGSAARDWTSRPLDSPPPTWLLSACSHFIPPPRTPPLGSPTPAGSGGEPACQHKFQASFLESGWAFFFSCSPSSHFQSFLSQPPAPGPLSACGQGHNSTWHHRGRWFPGKDGPGPQPNRCVCANIHVESGCYILSSTCVLLIQTKPALSARPCDSYWQPARPYKGHRGKEPISIAAPPQVTHYAGQAVVVISFYPTGYNSQQL